MGKVQLPCLGRMTFQGHLIGNDVKEDAELDGPLICIQQDSHVS